MLRSIQLSKDCEFDIQLLWSHETCKKAREEIHAREGGRDKFLPPKKQSCFAYTTFLALARYH